MGYTHYYYTLPELDPTKFAQICTDFQEIIPWLESVGVHLRGGFGTGSPTITDTEIIFNGDAKCGHERRNLGITWPSETASGVNTKVQYKMKSWFAGAQLEHRECGGDCSHETFHLSQRSDKEFCRLVPGKIFNFTKTAYKPYDLAVTACLVIAKHHLGDTITVQSDGNMKDWKDAMLLCKSALDYGSNFTLDEE